MHVSSLGHLLTHMIMINGILLWPRTSKIVFLAFILAITACSSDKDAPPDPDPPIALSGDCASFPKADDRLPATIAAEILDLHNEKRAEYCLPPLEWDYNLACVAQWWAETSGADGPHSAMADRLEKYREFSGCVDDCPESIGENMHWRQPWDFFDDSYVSGWLAEEQDSPSCNRGGAHYTQMVFELATKVGCAAFIDADGRLHFICEYDKWQGAYDPVFPDENCGCGGRQWEKAKPCD